MERCPAWIRGLRERARSGAVLGVEDLAAALARREPAERTLARARFDASVPYGRRVVCAADGLELMVAGWSRGRSCAPHDHGPGCGAVVVVQGRARHRAVGWRDGVLALEPAEVLRPGVVLRCPPGWVHQMQDDGGAQPLVTLHLYRGPTAPMVVYDLERARTQWLAEGCGAWPRPSGDPAVLREVPGLVPRSLG